MRCGYCNSPFFPSVHNQRYCSRRCKRDSENAARRTRRAETVQQFKGASLGLDRNAHARIFAVPDTHFPYEDKIAYATAVNALQGFKPTHVVVLGDFMDCEGISRFPKAPTRSHGLKLQEEFDIAHDGLMKLRDAAPTAEFYFIGGNHEFRLEKYLMERAPELWGLRGLEVNQLLRLDELNIHYTPYEASYVEILPGFIATHGTAISKHSAWSAQKEVDKWHCSGISGHVHRGGVYYQTTFTGNRCWMECGFLGSWAVPGCPPHANWQQGFGTVVIEDGTPWMTFHRIVNGKTVVEGTVYTAD